MPKQRVSASKPHIAAILNWAVRRQPIAVCLIVAGFFLVQPFAKPYFELIFQQTPLESSRAATIGYPRPRWSGINGGRIFIPSIKLSAPLFEGTRRPDDGIAHDPGTPLPGEDGNIVLSGHNRSSSKSSLFSLLYLVRARDEIILHFQGKRYVYLVEASSIVEPRKQAYFTKQTRDDRLTLITCYPPTSTAMRLVVTAKPRE